MKETLFKVRVYYEDTDMGGIVYHANYIKFCERARSEQFFSANVTLGDGDCHFVVKDLSAHFLKPARLGDLLHVSAQVLTCKNASLVVRHEIFKEEEKLFWMDVTLAYVCKGKLSRIDDATKTFLLR
ncbi:MAG: YbgC/FadM family acyl-CoA thioesterase [Campylobacterales bacterium]|nr:YbgC/FadM family acyl-CoA thioesterase [Campylobacterales bacterium]